MFFFPPLRSVRISLVRAFPCSVQFAIYYVGSHPWDDSEVALLGVMDLICVVVMTTFGLIKESFL